MQPFPNTPEHKHNTNNKGKRPKFHINDHVDILTEILTRLDAHSLGVAACVCRLWWSISHNDSIWEHLCCRHLSSSSSSPPLELRPVVKALGGYKRLYILCIRPALARLRRTATRWRVWSRDELQLSLSLFCIDYYERLGPRLGTAPASSSLMFLCKPVNV